MLLHRALIVRATSKHLIAFSEMLSPRLPCLCLRPETAFEFVQYLLWAFHFSCHLSQRKRERERERERERKKEREKEWERLDQFFSVTAVLSLSWRIRSKLLMINQLKAFSSFFLLQTNYLRFWGTILSRDALNRKRRSCCDSLVAVWRQSCGSCLRTKVNWSRSVTQTVGGLISCQLPGLEPRSSDSRSETATFPVNLYGLCSIANRSAKVYLTNSHPLDAR